MISKGMLLSAAVAGGLFVSSCSKDDTPSLNAGIPTASFTYNALTPTSAANASNLELINTSTGAMKAYWTVLDDQGNSVGTFVGDTVDVALTFSGDYTVKMAAGGPGGLSDTVQQSVHIAQDNTYAVGSTTLLGILTGAALGKTQRTWVPDRVLSSVIVWDTYEDALGQINGGGGAWWAFGPGEIATDGSGRDGYFDDMFTFTFGKVGKMIYDDNKTVYLDNGGSGWTKSLPAPWNSFQGTTSSTDLYNLVPALKPWGSGTFGYSVAAAPAGDMKQGTITITGKGGHFGLADKINGAEEVTPTAGAVTYDVLQMATDQVDAQGVHYDVLSIGVHYDGAGNVFTFMLRSDR